MATGRTLGCIVVFLSGLLATVPSVYADHFATGTGGYSLTPETLLRFQFTVASRPLQRSPSIPVTPVKVQVKVVHDGEPMSFQLFTRSTEIDSFDIVTDAAGTDTVTIEGELASTLVLGQGPDRQYFTESAHFVAEGVEASGENSDAFTIEITYSGQDIGPRLCNALGPACVTCNGNDTCIVFTGELAFGKNTIHSTGGI